ncbi:MAG: hypothetical protein V7K39_24015 [Nostoc sp.]
MVSSSSNRIVRSLCQPVRSDRERRSSSLRDAFANAADKLSERSNSLGIDDETKCEV